MGASISQRPGKCLKSRRAKSEENLGPKRNFKHNMGRFFAPWQHFISESITNNSRENVNVNARYYTYSDWINKDVTDSMEKSFNEIHRSNSLDKCDYETDYEKLVIDSFINGTIVNANEDQSSECGKEDQRRLTIDVNKDSIFEVNLRKGSRGLGFSILEYDGFIFIKQLFPLEAALQTGMLQEGDIILSANGNALTDLSSFEALQILRTLENPVTLIVCRLQQFLNRKPITTSSSHIFSNSSNSGTQCQDGTFSEFEITMKKVNGSLGFTLRKDDEDECSHVVRALVKEPALSDGRIKPGDQIISVNDKEIDTMTHQEAVKFLRDCDDEVRLKLRRSTVSSSLTSLNSSHFESVNKTLRKEALEMLNDLAVKKLKIESEDQLNNNEAGTDNDDDDEEEEEEEEEEGHQEEDEEEERNSSNSTSDSGGDSRENVSSTLKRRRDKRFDSTENLSNLQLSDHCLTSHSLHDNMQISDDLGKLADEPVSLPTLDVTADKISFHHNDPAYHSINVPNFSLKVNSDDAISQKRISPTPLSDSNKGLGLLKWKGVVLDAETEKEEIEESSDSRNEEIITVQLQRNWNSRLGFSLCAEDGCTIISAIHADSVASKDGRLKEKDKLITVNGENVEKKETSELIELLRTVRGKVTITVRRKKFQKT